MLEHPLNGSLRGERLSSREHQVLEMIALGLSNSQIAARLELSIHAVKFHLASVYRKLAVSNRTEAAVLFLQARAHEPNMKG